MVEEYSAVEKSFCGVRYCYLTLNDEFNKQSQMVTSVSTLRLQMLRASA
ncbi:hypothetical protein SRABI36_03408 [Pedobacter sp. Bi36]|nr:hypothetical protein SRABI36_03408 [Pedobacter sp. Bi36]CAH0285750.1 hypothetical protein SRABI126_03902 [Pedobacter sp. Bi126]